MNFVLRAKGGRPATTSRRGLARERRRDGRALFALITMFGPIPGAHFNPVITLALTFPARAARQPGPVTQAAIRDDQRMAVLDETVSEALTEVAAMVFSRAAINPD
jgi:hypothetical protein